PFALRRRVSMSATGSVIVMVVASFSSVPTRGPPRPACAISGLRVRRLEGEAERLEERTTFVVVLRRRDDGDVEASDAIDLVLVDLVEDRLLGDTERVVAAAVELRRGQAAEVTNARERERDEAIDELPGTVATEGDVRADRHALAELELRDRLASGRHLRLLPRDEREV